MKKTLLIQIVVVLACFISSNGVASGPKKIRKCMTIKKSGAYIVSKNLQATKKREGNCIIIEADYVSIDLNGFTLTGLGDNTGIGIWDNDPGFGMGPQGIVVRNGMITGFDRGIDLMDSEIITVDNIVAINNNWAYGISVGEGSTITRCKTEGLAMSCPSSVSYSIYSTYSLQTTHPNGPCDTATGNIEFPQ